MAGIEVVVLRCVPSETEVFPAQSCLESLCVQLNAFGLKLVHSLKQDNDLFIDALFVRFDYKKRLTLSIESSHNSLQLACEKLDQSIAERTALTKSLEGLKVERDQLRDSSEATAQELGALKAQAAEFDQERTALTKSLEGLKVEREQLRIKVDSQLIELDSIKSNLSKTEKQLVETRIFQQMHDEEMIKAEAQIELIKDLLLRE